MSQSDPKENQNPPMEAPSPNPPNPWNPGAKPAVKEDDHKTGTDKPNVKVDETKTSGDSKRWAKRFADPPPDLSGQRDMSMRHDPVATTSTLSRPNSCWITAIKTQLCPPPADRNR